MFQENLPHYIIRHPDWAPSANLEYQNTPQTSKRYERATERNLKKKRLDVAESLIQLSSNTEPSRVEREDIPESVVPPPVCKFKVNGKLKT